MPPSPSTRRSRGCGSRRERATRATSRSIDIGIPQGGPADPQIGLISARVTHRVPRRGRESTKFAAGSVLVCGGSLGLTGAPSMASEAAMRAGAGYVTAFVPASLNPIFESRLLEPMTVPLPDDDGSLTPAGADAVLEHVERSDALVLGPGIGRTDGAFELARRLARDATLPLLLDADGLNAHAGRLESLAQRSAPAVLTPHAGELARLIESDSGAIEARRLQSVRAAASAAQTIVVLKGDDTLVAHPDGRVGVEPRGRAGARHRGQRRRPLGRHRGLPGKAHGPVRGRVRGGTGPRRGRPPRGPANRAGGCDRERRDRGAAARADGGAPLTMARRAVADVDVAAIERNVSRLCGVLSSGTQMCAVVKCDGYGHGALRGRSRGAAGRREPLAVATGDEALELESLDVPVLVMGALTLEELAVLPPQAEVVAWSREFVAQLGDRRAKVHVKLDTGLGRLGTRELDHALEVAELVEAAPSLELVGAMTHFATADEDPDFLRRPAHTVRAVRRAASSAAAGNRCARRQQRRHADRAREPLRHGPLRDRDLRLRPDES